MEVDNAKAGQKRPLLPDEHILGARRTNRKLQPRMSDMILRRMPKLPLGGEGRDQGLSPC